MYIQLAAIIGNHSKNPDSLLKDDFYTMVMKDSEKNKGIRNINVCKDGFVVYQFNAESEQSNFINYIKTDFARFCLALLKNKSYNHCGEMELIPGIDFTEEWDDDKLFAKFDVSKELQDYIEDYLPDYYGIRK